ncbi:MAG: ATP-binding protein [Planctomycetota bacterium]
MSVPEAHELTLAIPADARFLAPLRAVIDAAGEVAGLGPEDRKAVALALSEAVSNVIEHCYCGAHGPVSLRCLMSAGKLEIRIRDYGPKPDLAKMHGRDLGDVRPGGLGIHIIHETMDEVEYDLSPAEGTELKLVKYAGEADQAAPE